MTDDRLFHLALASEWEIAQAAGAYARSTLGASLAEVGFIHCSRGTEQTERTRERFYSGLDEPVLRLHIDEEALEAIDLRVVDEPVDPADPASEVFPHLYGGPLPLTAVLEVLPSRM